jgi:N-dimethylarginine dimethylaminohydrolase
MWDRSCEHWSKNWKFSGRQTATKGDAMAEILMCPPTYYRIAYEINPWMNRQAPAEENLAAYQWARLRRLLEEQGATIRCLVPHPDVPDLVFTANAALIYRDVAIPAHFRHPERQAEEPLVREWLSAHGFGLATLSDEVFFEGAGDALFCGDTLFAGYRIRSDVRGQREIGERLQCRVLPLELVDQRYYHLDTCFCPLAPDVALYYPPAFDDYGRKVLSSTIDQLIPVGAAEAARFACNAVVLGRTVVTNIGCPQLHRDLEQRGFTPVATPLGEFIKAGGSAKCLTLRLDGEDAAAWTRDTLPEPWSVAATSLHTQS